MANPKYANAKCFVFSENGYEEITYTELCSRSENDDSYKSRKFIPLHGMLMEVTQEDYIEFYRNKRRQKYIDERAIENGDMSYDVLVTDAFDGRSIIAISDEDISEIVTNNMLVEKLHRCIQLLEISEQELIRALYFEGISERKLSAYRGIPQKTINNRKKRYCKN